MRIIYACGAPLPSKAAYCVHILQICQEFQRAGHAVEIWAQPPAELGPDFELERDLWEAFSIETRFPLIWRRDLRFTKGFGLPIRLALRALGQRPDLVICRNLKIALVMAWARIPTILEMHAPPASPRLLRAVLSAPGLRRIVVISEALRRHLAALVDPARMVRLPDAVALERFANLPSPVDARRTLGFDQNCFTAGYAGHMYRGRGIELILTVAARLPEQRFLLMGGEAEHSAHFERDAHRRGLGNVRLLGHIPNARIPLHLAACDALLMPYQSKVAVAGNAGDTARWCSPLKMFEYMAAGRLIISSNLPVLQEVLHSGNAVLCDPEDAEAWRAALARAESDAARRAALAARAQEDVQPYSWRARARALVEVARGER